MAGSSTDEDASGAHDLPVCSSLQPNLTGNWQSTRLLPGHEPDFGELNRRAVSEPFCHRQQSTKETTHPTRFCAKGVHAPRLAVKMVALAVRDSMLVLDHARPGSVAASVSSWLVGLALLVAGCSSLQATEDSGLRQARWRSPQDWIWRGEIDPFGNSPRLTEAVGIDWSTAIFRLQRGPCHGSCPVYAVSIYPDGRVEYEGRLFVGACGRHVGSITPAAHARLGSEFQAAHYFSSEYDDPNDLQTRGVDGAQLRVEVGRHYRQVSRSGPRGRIPRLALLEKLIDDVGQTARWTTCPREDCHCSVPADGELPGQE
jgi:hypothetical protein